MTPPKSRLYKKEYAEELLRIAKGDIEAGSVIKSARAGRAENLAYFAQQIVEKALKAILCFRGIAFPAVHDIRQLLELLPSDKLPPHAPDLGELTIYGTVRRYEEGPWNLSWEEATMAFDAAEEVFTWAHQILKNKP